MINEDNSQRVAQVVITVRSLNLLAVISVVLAALSFNSIQVNCHDFPFFEQLFSGIVMRWIMPNRSRSNVYFEPKQRFSYVVSVDELWTRRAQALP